MYERDPETYIYYEENMNKPRFCVSQIAEGLEFGHGSISGEAEPEVLQIMHETVAHDPEILVEIDTDENGEPLADDGCGDGRGVRSVFKFIKGKFVEFKRSLNRAKVFGGAVVMSAASRIGLGISQDSSPNEVFDESMDALDKEGMDYGAHTDEHAHGENCGCGAIDKFPEALEAAVAYEQPIRNVAKSLGVADEDLDVAYENFHRYVADLPQKEPYSGLKVMKRILGRSKVVKELGGEHRERMIVLNTMRGHTVNQELIRARTGGKAQIFAVDVWRLHDIARKLYKGSSEQQRVALASELIYTLGIAAVLTKGDLPVYMIEAVEAPVAV